MANKKYGSCFIPVLILVLIFSFPVNLFAVGSTGIENASFSAESLGQGNAVVAQANEPAAISYNPAGIVDLPGLQVQPNINFLSILTWFKSRTPDTVPGEKSSPTVVPVTFQSMSFVSPDFHCGVWTLTPIESVVPKT